MHNHMNNIKISTLLHSTSAEGSYDASGGQKIHFSFLPPCWVFQLDN